MKDAIKAIFKVSIGFLTISLVYQFIISKDHSISNAISLLIDVENIKRLIILLILTGISYPLCKFLFDTFLEGVAGVIFLVSASTIVVCLLSPIGQLAWGQVILVIIGIPNIIASFIAETMGMDPIAVISLIMILYYFIFCG